MDSVTITDLDDRFRSLVEQAERGEDVTITRDGVVVARVVAAPPPAKAGKRVLTPEQQQALAESMDMLRRLNPPPDAVAAAEPFDRDALYMERFERR